MCLSRSSTAAVALAALLLAIMVPAHSEQSNSRPTVSLEPGLKFLSGHPLLIRIFKEESELELWMRKDERFTLFASYPICFWSGTLGPKEYEGDQQAPEGFYAVDLTRLGAAGRHLRAIDIGYPNGLDRSLGRTGSHILLHGGCRSVGCFAMTDPIMDQIYALADQALRAGQDQIQVHIFPFRMTEAKLERHSNRRWYGFWSNLKQGYDMFEATRLAPLVHACHGSYLLTPHELARFRVTPAVSDQCASNPIAVTETAKTNRGAAASSVAPASHAPRASGVRSTSVRAALAPARDNVAECARLWTRDTGVSRQNWDAICKRLDFRPKGLLRSVHRAPRSTQPPRT